MAEAVADAMVDGTHLLVQAGTGTGKSLAYLVPALLHDSRVVVATATLALQHQLVERDLPRLVEAVGDLPGVDASYAVLKGRSNYACLHRIRAGVPDDQGALIEVPQGSMATKVLELRAWAEEEAEGRGSGERDNAPRHTDREWRQVSVNHRECLGAAKCPFGQECFAELAREKAQRSHLIVTNHSLLAIDAIEGVPMIPDYDVVVVDEAHELVSRITQAATDELFAADVDRAAKRSQRHVDGSEADDLADAGDALRAAINDLDPGRIDTLPDALGDALVSVRDRARACLSAYPKGDKGGPEATATPGSTRPRAPVQEVFATAERMAAHAESDVLWVTERGRPAAAAPLRRAAPGLGADARQAAHRQAGGLHQRDPAARRRLQRRGVELRAQAAENVDVTRQRRTASAPTACSRGAASTSAARSTTASRRSSTSPATCRRPAATGSARPQLDEIVELVDACEGRALGLFSSRRAAETAAVAVRERLPHLTTLAQGDAQLPELARQFVDDPHTALFGTLSLWQGLDVPGDTCQLVLIDRIPFPRPDDPLMSARQRAADQAGGNGFMQVAATHAALLLAQGTGRLIRTTTDRGVVAVLDPRLATARYGGFLKASLPPMWTTTDPAVARKALARLAAAAQSR